MTPDQEHAELDAEDAQELAEMTAERARIAMDERGRRWAEGPDSGKQARVTITVETEHGTVLAPATADPEIARAMRAEAAGLERKADGSYGAGFYPVGDS